MLQPNIVCDKIYDIDSSLYYIGKNFYYVDYIMYNIDDLGLYNNHETVGAAALLYIANKLCDVA